MAKLYKELLDMSRKECDSVPDQDLVPKSIHIYYTYYEYYQVATKIQKLVNDRINAQVTWEQISALYVRMTSAEGRFNNAKKKVESLELKKIENPDDPKITEKLKLAKGKLSRAEEELKIMNFIRAQVKSLYKKRN